MKRGRRQSSELAGSNGAAIAVMSSRSRGGCNDGDWPSAVSGGALNDHPAPPHQPPAGNVPAPADPGYGGDTGKHLRRAAAGPV